MKKTALLAFSVAAFAISSTAALARAGADYAVYGGDAGGTRFSTLTQINKGNVGQLQHAWRFDMATGASQMQPIVVDGVLYAVTTDGKAVALNAATGTVKWTTALEGAGGFRGRGVAFWGKGKDRRLLVPGRRFVYQVNADTGALITSFGTEGKIDLGLNLRGDDPTKSPIAMGSPPAIYKDVFITHGGVPEISPSAPGDIRGWDVSTGKLLWTFHTIPHPGEFGYETWPMNAYLTAGGANAWPGVIVDEKKGLVFVGTGSGADDFWGGERLGNNLFANSLIALDARTGKRLWHFQAVHHDMWDADFNPQPILVEVKKNGRTVDAVVAANKKGFIFAFDRKTGKSLFPIDEVPVPPSDVAGELASPTQPVPRLPAPVGLQSVTPETLTNRTPEANAWARDALSKMRNGPQFTPLAKGQDTIITPGFGGGVEWGGMAADPRGVIYANSNNVSGVTSLIDQSSPDPRRSKMNHSGYRTFVDPDGYPATAPPWGKLNAIDMNTGKYVWSIPFGYYPELAAEGKGNTGTENFGGPVVTASGLLFIGATVYDRKLRAFDTDTGKELWQTDLPFSGVASPATYMAGGEQYVVISASGARDPKGPKGAALVAFKLGR
ncbi:MAG: pyrroloquinoline quinone-dependent dehydrogenase [Croceibacterium sp.]